MPLLIATVAFGIFTSLLCFGLIGEASYCVLAAGTALVGIVLHGFGRLQELDLKNLRLVLRELESTKNELFVREEKLKAIITPLAQVIALTGASEGRFGDQKSWGIKREWYRQRVQALIDAIELSPAEEKNTKKYSEKYAEIDGVLGDREGLRTTDPDFKEVKEKLEKLGKELFEMMELDNNK